MLGIKKKLSDVQRTLDSCSAVLAHYSWLLDCYVLDYFIDDHWSKLPLSWQSSFEDMDPADLGNILAHVPPKTVLPLSFLALLKTVSAWSLAREPVQLPTQYSEKLSKKSPSNSCADHPRLRNLFLKHVKAKKRHEISLMCRVVSRVAEASGCRAAVDVGSGVGHLARSLAYRHGLRAAGVEREPALAREARKLDLELEYTASKHLSEEAVSSLHRPLHLNLSISSTTSFEELGLPPAMTQYGVVGLHPCGDLGPALLRQFARSENVRFICVVGCCYMKLTCGGAVSGYPMSDYLAARPCRLSYQSREISCHAIETYVGRLRAGNYHDLQVHAYRAALEVILVGLDSGLKHSGIRSVKHTNALSFESYCATAVERLGVVLPAAAVRGAETRGRLARWRRVVVFYTLRLTLAPLVETLVLLDRVLYLLERGISCDIWPVFDPRLSPRNHIIVGKRL